MWFVNKLIKLMKNIFDNNIKSFLNNYKNFKIQRLIQILQLDYYIA